MNVKDLMEALAKFDPDLEIETEGCDCWGDVAGVAQQELRDGPELLIFRSDGQYARDNHVGEFADMDA